MNYFGPKAINTLLFLLLMNMWPQSVLAAELSVGDTAWLLTSTALVLFMTIPGLALF
jgi:hypothetical protein